MSTMARRSCRHQARMPRQARQDNERQDAVQASLERGDDHHQDERDSEAAAKEALDAVDITGTPDGHRILMGESAPVSVVGRLRPLSKTANDGHRCRLTHEDAMAIWRARDVYRVESFFGSCLAVPFVLMVVVTAFKGRLDGVLALIVLPGLARHPRLVATASPGHGAHGAAHRLPGVCPDGGAPLWIEG